MKTIEAPWPGAAGRIGFRPDPARAVIAIAVALTAVAFALTALDAVGLALVWENLHWAVSGFAPVPLAYLAYRAAPRDEHGVRAWILAGMVMYALGQAAWILQVVLNIVTVPAMSDVGYLGGAIPIAIGLGIMATRRLSRAERVAFLVDGATLVTLIALMLSLAFGSEPLVGADPLAGAVLLAYPLVFLGAAGIGVLAMLNIGLRPSWKGINLLLIGLAANGIAWVIWVREAIVQLPSPGSPVNYIFSIAWLAAGVGAYGLSLDQQVGPRSSRRVARLLLAVFPMAAVAIALGVFAFTETVELDEVHAEVVPTVMVIVMMALIRQALLMRELWTATDRELQLREGERVERERAEAALAAQDASEKRYHEVVQVFGRLAEQLNFATDDDQLVRAGVGALRRLVPSGSGDILLANSSQDRLVVVAEWGLAEEAARIGQPVGEHPPSRCLGIRRGAPYVVADASDELSLPCPVHPRRSGSLMCVPMLSLGQAVGVIHLGSDEVGAFDEEAERHAARVAEELALAVGNARLMRQMESMALTDPLTGLHNARFFDAYFERELAKALDSGEPIGLIVIDIDHFKRFNDTHGHHSGDEALRSFARAALSVMRDADTIARYGGEEFIVAVRGADLESAAEVAERLRATVERASVEIGRGLYANITASLGVASTSTGPSDRMTLFKLADNALYRAKENGRNRVETSMGPAATRERRATQTD